MWVAFVWETTGMAKTPLVNHVFVYHHGLETVEAPYKKYWTRKK